jgi:hypothetical protein
VLLDDALEAQVYCNDMKDLGYAIDALGDNKGTILRTNIFEQVRVGILSRGRDSVNTGEIDDIGNISYSNANNFANAGTLTGFGNAISHLASINWGNGGGPPNSAASIYFRNGSPDEPNGSFVEILTSQQINAFSIPGTSNFSSDTFCTYSGSGGYDSIYSEYLSSAYAMRMMMEEQAVDQMLMQEDAEYDEAVGVKLFEAQQAMYLNLDSNPSVVNSSNLLTDYFQELESSDAAKAARVNVLKVDLAKEATQKDDYEMLAIQQQALSENAGINSTLNFLENERLVNDIYLQTLAVGIDTFAPSHKYVIDGIAPLCPYTNGKAVFEARMMQATYQPQIMYNDELNCNNTQSKKDRNLRVNDKWKVLPNPAQGWTWLMHPEMQNSKVELLGLDGVLQNTIFLSFGSKKTMIPLYGLSAGIYLLRVTQSGMTLFTDKIIVIL